MEKCVFPNTQNYIKMATNKGYTFAFYVAFLVHIIQMISTVLQNEQSQTCLGRIYIKPICGDNSGVTNSLKDWTLRSLI